MGEPTESLLLCPNVKKDPRPQGGVSLEYEPTMPTKFMVGTEQGSVLSCNRKAKSPSEKIVCSFSQHYGPVYAVQVGFFLLSILLSVGYYSYENLQFPPPPLPKNLNKKGRNHATIPFMRNNVKKIYAYMLRKNVRKFCPSSLCH